VGDCETAALASLFLCAEISFRSAPQLAIARHFRYSDILPLRAGP
jgi:hypothetical protein